MKAERLWIRISCALALTASLLASTSLTSADVESDMQRVERPSRGRARNASAVPQQRSAQDMDALRKRWERLSPAEQELMHERYQEFRKKTDDERKQLTRRAKRIDGIARELYRSLTPDVRAQIDELSPNERRAVMRDLAEEEARIRGMRILEMLPASVRKRLETAPQEERKRVLDEYRADQDARLTAVVAALGEELQVGEEAITRLNRLPVERRKKKLLEYLKRRYQRDIGAGDLPPGFPVQAYRRLSQLSPEEFYDALQRLRTAYPEFMRPITAPDAARDGAVPSDRVRIARARSAIRRAMRSAAREVVQYSGLSGKKRQAAISNRRRARVMAVLNAEQIVDEARRSELDELPSNQFWVEIRKLHANPLGEAERVKPAE